MLVASVRKYNRLIDPKYKPSLLKSKYACTDGNYMEGYKLMLDKLSKSTSKPDILGIDSCYWVWVENPFFELYSLNSEKSYVCVYDIPEKDIVFSDYDIWSTSLNFGTIPIESCFDCSLGKGNCIQGVTWELPWSSMVCAIPLKNSYNLSIEELISKAYCYDNKSILEYEYNHYKAQERDFLDVSKYYCKSVYNYLDALINGRYSSECV